MGYRGIRVSGLAGVLLPILFVGAGCGGSANTASNATGGASPGSASGGAASAGTGGTRGAGGVLGSSGGDTSLPSGSGGKFVGSGGRAGSGSGTGASPGNGGAATGRDGGSDVLPGTGGGATGGGGVVFGAGACPADPNLPKEPVDPPACATLMANKAGPDEANLDTARIQTALDACGAGKAVRLLGQGANNAFVVGKLTIRGTYLSVDAGTTLYASRNPASYGCTAGPSAAANSCGAVITATGNNAGIVGNGVIDGQGGEPVVGQSQSWWDISVALRASNGSASNPALISVTAASNFVMHNIRLYNSPKFHVKLASAGFVVWGVEVLTPSRASNSAGKALSPYGARNTDGIDPSGGGGGATPPGYIVCSKISVGDDEIAIKGGNAPIANVTIAHNHFGTGHGMSIGSETNAGVSNISVYDLTIDGTIPTGGAPNSDINGIRIKSDASRGGPVDRVTYSDICMRSLANPILLNPMYSSASGNLIPSFTNIAFKNIHATGGGTVTLSGFDSSHISSASLDNVVIDGTPTAQAANARVALGPGAVSFAIPAGAGVTVTGAKGISIPVDCSARWVTFP